MHVAQSLEYAEQASGVDVALLVGVAVGLPVGEMVDVSDRVGEPEGVKAHAAAATAEGAAGPAHSHVVTPHRDEKGAAAVPGAHTPRAVQ